MNSLMYSPRIRIAAIMVAAIAVMVALSACGSEDNAAALNDAQASIAAQNAEIEALSAQVSGLQSEILGQAELIGRLAEIQQQLDADANDDDGKMMDAGRLDDLSAEIEGVSSAVSDIQNRMDDDGDRMMEAEKMDNLAAELAVLSAAIADLQDSAEAGDDAQSANGERIEGVAAGLASVREALTALQDADASSDINDAAARLDWLEHVLAPAYTKAYVEAAVRRYNAQGRQATIDYYNSLDSVSGDLYIFVLDENYQIIVHPTIPSSIGVDIRGPLGTDITGKNYGAEFVTVDENGKWVDYVLVNPANNFEYERKHSWSVRHGGLIFGSGWYERGVSLETEPAAYATALVSQAIARYDALGHEDTIAYYNTPESMDGEYYVFIGDENDVMIAHAAVPANVGLRFDEVISPDDGYPAGAQVAAAAMEGGAWTTYTYLNASTDNIETKHSWVTRHNGMIFGSGWYEEGPPKTDGAEYAQALVQRATHLYDDLGREAAIAFYNSPQSLDGEWYTFVLDAGDFRSLASAARPERVGTVPERIDATGYDYGAEFATVTEDGKWVSYMFQNPAMNDELAQKRTWLVKRGGLIFGAGFYEE